MTWVKIDDRMPEHPKVLQVGDSDALWLHVCALCYCNRNLTNGFVHADIVPRLSGTKRHRQAVAKLVAARLWHEVTDGYQIHDYLEFQRSKDHVVAELEAGKKRAAKSYERRKSSDDLRPKNPEDSESSSPILQRPIPSHPIPTTSSLYTTSTTSTGVPGVVVAEAVAIYVEADLAARSITEIRNPASYRETVANNAYAKFGPAIAAHLERRPDATAHDLATEVLGVDEFTARQLAKKRDAS